MSHKKKNLKWHAVFRLEQLNRQTFMIKTRIDVGREMMPLCLIMLNLKY